jgi:hypothetical protein
MQKSFVLFQQTKQKMFRLDVGRPEQVRFATSTKDHSLCFFRVPFKHEFLSSVSGVKISFPSTTNRIPHIPAAVEGVGKVGIQRLLLDFQARWESPGFGLFHRAAFSTPFAARAIFHFARPSCSSREKSGARIA